MANFSGAKSEDELHFNLIREEMANLIGVVSPKEEEARKMREEALKRSEEALKLTEAAQKKEILRLTDALDEASKRPTVADASVGEAPETADANSQTESRSSARSLASVGLQTPVVEFVERGTEAIGKTSKSINISKPVVTDAQVQTEVVLEVHAKEIRKEEEVRLKELAPDLSFVDVSTQVEKKNSEEGLKIDFAGLRSGPCASRCQ